MTNPAKEAHNESNVPPFVAKQTAFVLREQAADHFLKLPREMVSPSCVLLLAKTVLVSPVSVFVILYSVGRGQAPAVTISTVASIRDEDLLEPVIFQSLIIVFWFPVLFSTPRVVTMVNFHAFTVCQIRFPQAEFA